MASSNPVFTPDEQAFTNHVLALADTKKLGIIPGDVAVSLFAGSNIPSDTLGDIWQIADSENNGFLTRKGLGVALRLMSHVQFGEELSEALVMKPAPPPTIKGVTPLPTKPATPVASPRPVPPVPAQRPSTVYTAAYPPITAEDRAKFTRIFAQSGPVNGLLSGDKARDVFLKSKLPVDTLGKIWSLADSQSRGSLDLTDFILGMFFIQGTMNKSLPSLPAILPPELYEQASGGRARVSSPMPASPISRQPTGQQAVNVHMTGGSIHSVSSPGLASQFPQAPSVHRTASLSSRSSTIPPNATSAPFITGHATSGQSWDITPVEKVTSDRFFASLDTEGKGFITGDIAVPFLLESKLPESVLAHVWDLSDIDNSGRLDRDGFAVAMHLINGQLAGRELPQVLPESLIPPSKRKSLPQTQKSTVDDLFSLMDDGPLEPIRSPSVPPVQPQATGSSSVGRAVSAPHVPVAPRIPAVPHIPADLMGDDISEEAEPVSDRSAEVGNLQNQLASTERSLTNVKSERAPMERKVADYASQIAQLETQLATAKASYDTESRLLTDVRSRAQAQTEQIKSLKEDLIRSESDLSAIRLEKAEIEGALLRDKEDVRDMQRKMRVLSEETDKVKADLEKVKNDARLQKGLVAIAKKQLATAEGEKAKALELLAATQKDLEQTKRETDEAEAATAVVRSSIPEVLPPSRVLSPTLERSMAVPLPETPEPLATPSLSTLPPKSNNPFDRLTKGLTTSGASSPVSITSPLALTPQPTATNITAVDNVKEAEPLTEQVVTNAEHGVADEGQKDEGVEENPFGAAYDDGPEQEPSQAPPNAFDELFGAEEPFTPQPASDSPVEPMQNPLSQADDHQNIKPGPMDALQEAETHFPPVEDVSGSTVDEFPAVQEIVEPDGDSSDDEEEWNKQEQPKDTPEQVQVGAAFPRVSGSNAVAASWSSEPFTQKDKAAAPVPAHGETQTTQGTPSFGTDTNSTSDQAGHSLTAPNGPFAEADQPAANLTEVPFEVPQSSAVDDFDEALGQIPSTGAAEGPFQFDSAFGDSFGKDSFSETGKPASVPISVLAPTINGHNTTAAPQATPSLLDDFDTLLPDNRAGGHAATGSSTAPSLSFDDAFVVPSASVPQPPRSESTRSVFAANMASPLNPPRKSGSKNKGLILNPNMPAVFHSTLAPPPQEHAEGTMTPALPDDVEGVKQLCGMGFTRSQAVAALEKYGYDVSKALNSLLG